MHTISSNLVMSMFDIHASIIRFAYMASSWCAIYLIHESYITPHILKWLEMRQALRKLLLKSDKSGLYPIHYFNKK